MQFETIHLIQFNNMYKTILYFEQRKVDMRRCYSHQQFLVFSQTIQKNRSETSS